MDKKSRGLIEIHAATILFGIAGLFGKLISLPPAIIVLGRVAFAVATLAIIFLLTRKSISLYSKKDCLYLALLGMILAVHWVTFFQSIQVSTVAVGLLTFSTFPVFVSVSEPCLRMDRFKPSDLLVAAITFLGVALVIPEFNLGNNIAQGAAWGIASGFTFAIISIFNRKLVQRYSSTVILFYQYAIAMLVLSPFLLLTRAGVSAKDIVLLALLGIVFTVLAHSLFIKGMLHITARTASIIASMEPVYGIALAALILGEIPAIRTILGGGIVLAAAVYVTVKK